MLSLFRSKVIFKYPVRFRSDPVFVDDHIACLTLHPVTWPNHGAAIELSLASEALGLVRSLDWDIVKGPTKVIKPENEEQSDAEFNAESRGRTTPTMYSHGSVIR